ncbi:hypothetical protein M758_7G055200, partial [Ceratodon purpureus]
ERWTQVATRSATLPARLRDPQRESLALFRLMLSFAAPNLFSSVAPLFVSGSQASPGRSALFLDPSIFIARHFPTSTSAGILRGCDLCELWILAESGGRRLRVRSNGVSCVGHETGRRSYPEGI